ncbi:hypothetical protein OAE63_01760, partial [bacterium]|nr:hypothetical protein [bacterium]
TQTDVGWFCWVKRDDGYVRNPIQLGDGNDIFLVVEQGLEAGDEVALSPQAIVADLGLESVDSGSDQSISGDAGGLDSGRTDQIPEVPEND